LVSRFVTVATADEVVDTVVLTRTVLAVVVFTDVAGVVEVVVCKVEVLELVKVVERVVY
jgi:hypothetical protein